MKNSVCRDLIIDHQGNKTLAEFVHSQLRALVLSPHYTCVGAKAAFNQSAYMFAFYAEMGSSGAVRSLYDDLCNYIETYEPNIKAPPTFIATFNHPNITSEQRFEELLWQQLQLLHTLDKNSQWDAQFSDNPEDPHFSFSFLERGFFVVGLHAMSSRWSRRFAWPTLIFNAQDQFEQLKVHGRYKQMECINRKRDKKLQGSINPNLAVCNQSEARQYSGKRVELGWKCPFHRQ